MNEKIIGYIDNGIVIDHIPVGKVRAIADILGVFKECKGMISLGDGYGSSKINKKGLLKVEGFELSNNQLDLIALVADDVSVSVIENRMVKRKVKIQVPDKLEGIIYCPNLNCISNDLNENVLSYINHSIEKRFSCHYCGTEFLKEDMKFILNQ